MKAYVIAILGGIVLISVALATVSGHIQNFNSNSPGQISSSQPLDKASLPSSSDPFMAATDVSSGIVIQEVVTTALLVIGSIIVLRKK